MSRPSSSPAGPASSAPTSSPCCSSGADKVRLFDNMFRGDRAKVAELVASSNGNVEFIDQDVRYGGAVHDAMKGCDKVIHLAAVSINKSQADPYESVDINLVGGNNVFAAAADHGISRVVFASARRSTATRRPSP